MIAVPALLVAEHVYASMTFRLELYILLLRVQHLTPSNMPLGGIDACKRALRVTRAQFQRGVGDVREIIRKRSKGVKKTRGQLRKLEAKVKELGGALSEEVSDGSTVLCDTSSGSDSDMVSEDAKAESPSTSDNGIGKKVASSEQAKGIGGWCAEGAN